MEKLWFWLEREISSPTKVHTVSGISKCIWIHFNQCKDKTMSVLRGLLQNLSAELREEQTEFNSEAKATQGTASEVRLVFTLQACFPPLCVWSPADDLSPWPRISSDTQFNRHHEKTHARVFRLISCRGCSQTGHACSNLLHENTQLILWIVQTWESACAVQSYIASVTVCTCLFNCTF